MFLPALPSTPALPWKGGLTEPNIRRRSARIRVRDRTYNVWTVWTRESWSLVACTSLSSERFGQRQREAVWKVVIPEMVQPSVTRLGIQDMELKCRTLGSA